jgi:hypothetical protein
MNRAHLLLLALTACGAPFRVESTPADSGGDEQLELDAGDVADAIASHDVAEGGAVDGLADAGPDPTEASIGDERRPSPDAAPDVVAPDAPVFSPEAGVPEAAPIDAGRVGAVCCNLGTSCHSAAAACPIAANGTPTCYCGSARACEAGDLGAYCYLINGCSGTVAWCPGGDQ